MSRPDQARGKLTFDAARCDGWGMCTVAFPEGISLDPWGFANVTRQPIEDSKLLEKARRAVACCPRAAISLDVQEALPTPRQGPAQE